MEAEHEGADVWSYLEHVEFGGEIGTTLSLKKSIRHHCETVHPHSQQQNFSDWSGVHGKVVAYPGTQERLKGYRS
jgi:hypothetical protein